jgi:hypothetical protein
MPIGNGRATDGHRTSCVTGGRGLDGHRRCAAPANMAPAPYAIHALAGSQGVPIFGWSPGTPGAWRTQPIGQTRGQARQRAGDVCGGDARDPDAVGGGALDAHGDARSGDERIAVVNRPGPGPSKTRQASARTTRMASSSASALVTAGDQMVPCTPRSTMAAPTNAPATNPAKVMAERSAACASPCPRARPRRVVLPVMPAVST